MFCSFGVMVSLYCQEKKHFLFTDYSVCLVCLCLGKRNKMKFCIFAINPRLLKLVNVLVSL